MVKEEQAGGPGAQNLSADSCATCAQDALPARRARPGSANQGDDMAGLVSIMLLLTGGSAAKAALAVAHELLRMLFARATPPSPPPPPPRERHSYR